MHGGRRKGDDGRAGLGGAGGFGVVPEGAEGEGVPRRTEREGAAAAAGEVSDAHEGRGVAPADEAGVGAARGAGAEAILR